MDKRVRQGLDQGIREFNEGAFFEAHDTLEDTWMDVRGGNRLFFQGLIQLSIGYYHLTCVNYRGADHLLSRGFTKLEAYLPSRCGVQLQPLLAQVQATLQGLRQMTEGTHSVTTWSFPKIETVLENPERD